MIKKTCTSSIGQTLLLDKYIFNIKMPFKHAARAYSSGPGKKISKNFILSEAFPQQKKR